jgi:hypothetical protein
MAREMSTLIVVAVALAALRLIGFWIEHRELWASVDNLEPGGVFTDWYGRGNCIAYMKRPDGTVVAADYLYVRGVGLHKIGSDRAR